jgi:hypothetical protein
VFCSAIASLAERQKRGCPLSWRRETRIGKGFGVHQLAGARLILEIKKQKPRQSWDLRQANALRKSDAKGSANGVARAE